jgi:hypothetical protein
MDARRGVDWTGLPVIAIVVRLLCRELTLQNDPCCPKTHLPPRRL